MKKILLLITSILAISAFGVAGCKGNDQNSGNNTGIQSRTYEMVQEEQDSNQDGTDNDNSDGEGDNEDRNDCEDGNCRKRHHCGRKNRGAPDSNEIGFRQPRRRHDDSPILPKPTPNFPKQNI